MSLPSLDRRCSQHFRFLDVVKCGETVAQTSAVNVPAQEQTYDWISLLATKILDPVFERFGSLRLTYGFASKGLTKFIPGRICPHLDQHAGAELDSRGKMVCGRGGQAVDFHVPGVPSETVACWIAAHTGFDRLYFYGSERPVHVSWSPEPLGQIVHLRARPTGRRVPRVVQATQLAAL